MKRLNMSYVLIFLMLPSMLLVAVGAKKAKEESAAPERGKYLAERGRIVPPEEIYIDSYVGYIDYQYPKPETDLEVYLYSGHNQISSKGQEEIIHIGIQGNELSFEELPPMNLAFVIDKSGSMSDLDKMDWVKESFYIFLDSVREKDFVALIFFDNTAQTVFPSTRMDSIGSRQGFRNEVYRVLPGGGTNLMDGVHLGYKEVLKNFRSEYINRVLLLSDGQATSSTKGLLEMAETYKSMGINISTIGLGEDFDLDLMRSLAHAGGGSSRFISGREEMEETFGSELDRMVVPIAHDLHLKLEFLQEVEILETWGYDHQIAGSSISYFLPTLHHRDYETILVQLRIPPLDIKGKANLLRLTLFYEDLGGNHMYKGPYYLECSFVDLDYPVTGFSDAMVIRSGTMLHFAQALQEIGQSYYRGYGEAIQNALDLTIETRKELLNARERLDYMGFDDEIKILDNYLKIFSWELSISDSETARIVEDVEIVPPVQERSLQEHIANLYAEMALDLSAMEGDVVAVSGFSMKDGTSSQLTALLNEMALVEITKLSKLTVIERDKLNMILKEQSLSLSDLMDTDTAINVGRLLTANHILTGTVIEMPSSVVIFGRIINVETAEIESAAQVIVPKNREVKALLNAV